MDREVFFFFFFFKYISLLHSDLMSEMSNKLNQTEETLSQITKEENGTDTKLDALREDAQKLERTVKELLDQVEFIKNSDIRGKEDT